MSGTRPQKGSHHEPPSDTKGAHAGARVGGSGLMIDRGANEANYRRAGVQVAQILDGRVQNPNNVLDRVLGV